MNNTLVLYRVNLLIHFAQHVCVYLVNCPFAVHLICPWLLAITVNAGYTQRLSKMLVCYHTQMLYLNNCMKLCCDLYRFLWSLKLFGTIRRKMAWLSGKCRYYPLFSPLWMFDIYTMVIYGRSNAIFFYVISGFPFWTTGRNPIWRKNTML